MKRGETIAGPKWYVLCGSWRNSDGVNCEVSLAFDSEINYIIHRNIIGSFLNNLMRYRNEFTAAASANNDAHLKGDQLGSGTPSSLFNNNSYNVDSIYYEHDFLERNQQEPSTPVSVATKKNEFEQDGHQRRFSVKCMRGFAWFK